MDQTAWGYSEPVLFNRQQGDNLQSISVTLEDWRGLNWAQPIAANNPRQAASFSCPFVQPRGGSLPLSPTYADSEQFPGASLLYPANYADAQGHAQPRGASPAYTGFEQSPGASLPYPANYGDVQGYAQPRGATLPLSPAYTGFEQSPEASLLYPANYGDVQGYAQPRGATLPLSPAYTDFEQSPDISLLPSSLNHAYFPGSASTEYRSYANEFSLLQPQSNHGDVFPDISPNYTLLRPQCSACGGCRCPTGDQNSEQSFPRLEHQSANQPGLNDNPNYVPSLNTNHAPATSDSRPCVRCRLQKKKCQKDTSDRQSRCLGCVKQGIPASICSLVITWITPFDKCLDTKHQLRYTSIQSSGSSFSKTVQLGHYPKGPTLTIECCQFRATDVIQTSILRKNRHGYYKMTTPAWCLKDPMIDISPYLQECVEFSMAEACERQHPQLSLFFCLARIYKNVPIMQLLWKEFTALRLLRLWWDFASSESLGIEIVKEKESPFYGFKPIPRMLRDQLNHALELEMMALDTKILRRLRSILENEEPHMWVIGILVLFLLLHIREVYAGQHLYWKHSYIELADLWNHQSSPAAIIDKVVASCNSILSFFHFSRGPKLLNLNWDSESKNGFDYPWLVGPMKMLQAHAHKLKTDGWIGRKAYDVFKAGNPNSVELTVCSLTFESTKKGCEVKGFY